MKQWENGSSYDPRGSYFGLKRLDWNKPSRTILKGDGVNRACGCCHPKENRRLTIPELRRVGSFPDAFQFVGKTRDQWARIGNSVPPMFMFYLASHIYTHILSKIEHIEEAEHV